ncbi:MAG: GNAT family N-acetyltransferase [Candidatus Obscuribacterales bacterium]|jgi:GNAT superfamily N-acetyltransferase|nr:GNAT family N-acetyltransferase [Candidatus Obscuribacterales bacterium]
MSTQPETGKAPPVLKSEAQIIIATVDQLDDLTPLFDAYRVFYRQASDAENTKKFLSERMHLRDTVIFMAYVNSRAVGFTQLFPSFSSETLERLWILNDLYIAPEMRGKRIGAELIQRAKQFVVQFGAKGLALATEHTNLSGQKLYEREGFELDEIYRHYFWEAQRNQ